jgi:hypothetical protein
MSAKPEPAKARKAVMRSPGYPALSLSEAIEKAKIIWEHEKKHPAPLSALETHWGFTVGSGAVSRTVASLGKYGLLEDEGAGNNKNYKLTEAALEIILAPEGSAEKASRIKEASLAPAIFKELWDHFGGELPSDANLESHLLLKKHFNPGKVKEFIQTFKSTLDFASNFDSVPESVTGNNPPPLPLSEEEKKKKIPPLPPSNPPMNPALQALSNLNELSVPVGDNRMAKIPFPISEEDFELFINTLTLWKKKLIIKPMVFPAVAIWKNKDFDKQVTLTGYMGETGGVKYYRSEDGTGIPQTELIFG